MEIYDEYNNFVDTENMEVEEQKLAKYYILPDDVVLELGGRYGSVSCIINSKLNNKTNEVVVEPDQRVWDALEKNRNRNKKITIRVIKKKNGKIVGKTAN